MKFSGFYRKRKTNWIRPNLGFWLIFMKWCFNFRKFQVLGKNWKIFKKGWNRSELNWMICVLKSCPKPSVWNQTRNFYQKSMTVWIWFKIYCINIASIRLKNYSNSNLNWISAIKISKTKNWKFLHWKKKFKPSKYNWKTGPKTLQKVGMRPSQKWKRKCWNLWKNWGWKIRP